MITDRRVDLAVERSEHETVQSLGARWDTNRSTWFVEPGAELAQFVRWPPPSNGSVNGVATVAPSPVQGVTLSSFLGRVKHAIIAGMPQAEWVRAEIRKIQTADSGNVYLELEERDGAKVTVATAKGLIWKQRVASIQDKFRAGTGGTFQANMKILVRVRADFHAVYGFDLIIEDIDPSYTLGDLAAKLDAIRKTLRAEKVFDANRQLKPPVEFVRVAVISPGTSAGLGDFRREADRLDHAGLCAFDYYIATFQGPGAPSSIRESMREAYTAHQADPYDALVIIRGGGSVTDLAWLNDLTLGRWVCRVPIPVFTGIGHQQDSTILDEIAHRKFDTPSKVALHIAHTIRDNAVAARRDAEKVVALTRRTLARQRDALCGQRSRLEEQVGFSLGRAERDALHCVQDVNRNAAHVVREARTGLQHLRGRVSDAATQVTCDAARNLEEAQRLLAERARVQARSRSADSDRTLADVVRNAREVLASAADDCTQIRDQLGREAVHHVTLAAGELQRQRDAVSSSVNSIRREASMLLDFCVQRTIGMGPEATLRRGYAIARDEENRPIGSKNEAMKRSTLQIEFHDGRLAVENRERGGEQGQ